MGPSQERINSRTWLPSKSDAYGFRMRANLPPSKIIAWNRNRRFNQIRFYSLVQKRMLRICTSLVVAVDGASRGNHDATQTSRAAYGVFFGRDPVTGRGSPHNAHARLGPGDGPPTSNRAELMGAQRALKVVDAMWREGELGGVRHVIVKTDSKWLADSMCEWVWGWEGRDGLNAAGVLAAHWEEVEKLHELIKVFEAERAVAVRFWWVPREFNREADGLANKALDEVEDEGYDD